MLKLKCKLKIQMKKKKKNQFKFLMHVLKPLRLIMQFIACCQSSPEDYILWYMG